MQAVRIHAYCVVPFLCCFTIGRVQAADSQSYSASLEFSGSADIDNALRSSSVLVTLQNIAPVPPFGLITRASGDIERLTTAIGCRITCCTPIQNRGFRDRRC